MPIASGAGHWPKEHLVAAAVEKVAQPSGPSYVQSYMPQYTAPNKILPQKSSYITQGPSQPQSPSPTSSNYPKYPNQPSSPSNGQPYPQYDTPPPRYSSANPRDGGPDGPRSPRYGDRPPYRNPNPQPKPPRSWRASEKYGQGGHHRFGNGGPSTRTDFGHNRYGVQYNSTRQVMNVKGTRPVGPKGLESYEMYGPRMNMTTGCCGPQMRPLWAMFGGLLALGALGGIIAGIVLGVKTTTTVKKLGYINPLGSVRYYLQNGAFEPCVDRYATTTPIKTTPRPTTRPTTTIRTTTGPSTTHCIPITINTVTTPAAKPPITTHVTITGTPQITTKPTVPTTTVCIWTPAPPTTTTASTTTPVPTTTTPTTTVPTTTPPLTTQTTLPFCDTLTTTYTLITLNPLPSPVIYSGARPNTSAGAGLLLLLLAIITKLFVD